MRHNHALALAARKVLCEVLQTFEPCSEEFISSLAAVALPDATLDALPQLPFNEYPLQNALRLKYGTLILIRPEFTQFPTEGELRCRKRLGGLLR